MHLNRTLLHIDVWYKYITVKSANIEMQKSNDSSRGIKQLTLSGGISGAQMGCDAAGLYHIQT